MSDVLFAILESRSLECDESDVRLRHRRERPATAQEFDGVPSVWPPSSKNS